MTIGREDRLYSGSSIDPRLYKESLSYVGRTERSFDHGNSMGWPVMGNSPNDDFGFESVIYPPQFDRSWDDSVVNYQDGPWSNCPCCCEPMGYISRWPPYADARHSACYAHPFMAHPSCQPCPPCAVGGTCSPCPPCAVGSMCSPCSQSCAPCASCSPCAPCASYPVSSASCPRSSPAPPAAGTCNPCNSRNCPTFRAALFEHLRDIYDKAVAEHICSLRQDNMLSMSESRRLSAEKNRARSVVKSYVEETPLEEVVASSIRSTLGDPKSLAVITPASEDWPIPDDDSEENLSRQSRVTTDEAFEALDVIASVVEGKGEGDDFAGSMARPSEKARHALSVISAALSGRASSLAGTQDRLSQSQRSRADSSAGTRGWSSATDRGSQRHRTNTTMSRDVDGTLTVEDGDDSIFDVQESRRSERISSREQSVADGMQSFEEGRLSREGSNRGSSPSRVSTVRPGSRSLSKRSRSQSPSRVSRSPSLSVRSRSESREQRSGSGPEYRPSSIDDNQAISLIEEPGSQINEDGVMIPEVVEEAAENGDQPEVAEEESIVHDELRPTIEDLEEVETEEERPHSHFRSTVEEITETIEDVPEGSMVDERSTLNSRISERPTARSAIKSTEGSVYRKSSGSRPTFRSVAGSREESRASRLSKRSTLGDRGTKYSKSIPNGGSNYSRYPSSAQGRSTSFLKHEPFQSVRDTVQRLTSARQPGSIKRGPTSSLRNGSRRFVSGAPSKMARETEVIESDGYDEEGSFAPESNASAFEALSTLESYLGNGKSSIRDTRRSTCRSTYPRRTASLRSAKSEHWSDRPKYPTFVDERPTALDGSLRESSMPKSILLSQRSTRPFYTQELDALDVVASAISGRSMTASLPRFTGQDTILGSGVGSRQLSASASEYSEGTLPSIRRPTASELQAFSILQSAVEGRSVTDSVGGFSSRATRRPTERERRALSVIQAALEGGSVADERFSSIRRSTRRPSTKEKSALAVVAASVLGLPVEEMESDFRRSTVQDSFGSMASPGVEETTDDDDFKMEMPYWETSSSRYPHHHRCRRHPCCRRCQCRHYPYCPVVPCTCCRKCGGCGGGGSPGVFYDVGIEDNRRACGCSYKYMDPAMEVDPDEESSESLGSGATTGSPDASRPSTAPLHRHSARPEAEEAPKERMCSACRRRLMAQMGHSEADPKSVFSKRKSVHARRSGLSRRNYKCNYKCSDNEPWTMQETWEMASPPSSPCGCGCGGWYEGEQPGAHNRESRFRSKSVGAAEAASRAAAAAAAASAEAMAWEKQERSPSADIHGHNRHSFRQG